MLLVRWKSFRILKYDCLKSHKKISNKISFKNSSRCSQTIQIAADTKRVQRNTEEPTPSLPRALISSSPSLPSVPLFLTANRSEVSCLWFLFMRDVINVFHYVRVVSIYNTKQNFSIFFKLISFYLLVFF